MMDAYTRDFVLPIAQRLQDKIKNNSCTTLDAATYILDKVAVLAHNIGVNPTGVSSNFIVGHAKLESDSCIYDDMTYDSYLAHTNIEHTITGFVNVGFYSKFMCFKSKYLVRWIDRMTNCTDWF